MMETFVVGSDAIIAINGNPMRSVYVQSFFFAPPRADLSERSRVYPGSGSVPKAKVYTLLVWFPIPTNAIQCSLREKVSFWAAKASFHSSHCAFSAILAFFRSLLFAEASGPLSVSKR